MKITNPENALLGISEKERMDAISAAALAGNYSDVVVLRHNGAPVTNEVRDELLRKCAAGEYVELNLTVTAYTQETGVRNRNCVRLADSAMEKFGKTGIGKPFIKDHQQRDTMSVCGKITDCSTEKLGDGKFAVKQEVKLTAPWAVELALRDLLHSVSISWMATGPVECSVCKTQILTKCYHWPGDKLTMKETPTGKVLSFDRGGSIVVEWVYTSAEIIETSPVPVPAVTTAKIDDIRATLSAAHSVNFGADDIGTMTDHSPSPTITENTTMTDTEIQTLQKRLERAEKLAELSDAERQYLNRLPGHAAEAFLSLSAADRHAKLAPVYTSPVSGQVFNSSHDPSMIEMAKRMDAQHAELQAQLLASRVDALQARADAELGHLPGTREQRAALLGAVENIADEAHRTFAKELLSQKETNASKKFTRQGAGGGAKPTKLSSAQAEFDALVQAHMAENDCDETEAFGAIMETEKGLTLYTKTEQEKADRRNAAQGVEN